MTEILPPPGRNTPEGHMVISRGFVDHARNQLARGNRLQASEKLWGAAAHALKSIAVQRGWRHGHRSYIFAIAEQLGEEYGRPDFTNKLSIADSMHVNFYENERGEYSISNAIAEVEQFVDDLDEVRSAPPRPFTVETNSARDRLQRLLGKRVKLGDHSDVGFAQAPRRRRARGDNGRQ